jgi:hypothetical protein
VKDSPAIILASGLAGLLGVFFPTAQGWVLDQSLVVMGTELSVESLGLFAVSRLLFLPSLIQVVLGALAMRKKFATRFVGIFATLSAAATMLAWLFQRATIDQLSIVGVGPSIGLFLLLVSGLGGLLGGAMLVISPQNQATESD